jgi:thioredoxin reductase (NADPH)
VNTTTRDVIIVGGGAAGLSAGLVLARARADVLLIDSGNPRNATAVEMRGFLSRDGIAPAEFLALARHEISGYGGEIVSGVVASIEREGTGFRVSLSDVSNHATRAVLIATGLRDELPFIPGLRDRWGVLVHHCPYCHGFEVSNQKIVVIGGAARELSLKQAGLLRRNSEDVTLVTHAVRLTEDERHRLTAFGVRVIDGTVSHLVGATGTIAGLALTDGTVVDCAAVFIAPLQRPNDALLRALGCDSNPHTGLVIADQAGQTSAEGVWAAGNVVTPTAQVITAAGAGSASAIAINGWLLNKDLDAASALRNQ